jgi:UDP-glucose 4-epimerase
MGHVLVTGAAGYIGGHAALALADAGEKVMALDWRSGENAPEGRRSHIARHDNIAWTGAQDVGNEEEMERLFRDAGIKEIVHLAAYVSVEESVREPESYFENNAEATKRLLAAAKRAGVDRFIFSSTAAVYGTPDLVPVDETAPLRPESPYGESKLVAESAIRESGIAHTILRFFNVAGVDPQGRAGYVVEPFPTHLIRCAAYAALRGGSLKIFGSDYPTQDGTAVRDFVHVSDVASAHVAALQALRRSGRSDTLNVGTGRGYSVLEVLGKVRELSGTSLAWEFGPRRPGDVAAVVADVRRIREALGWESKHTLADMIRDELRWVSNRFEA